MPVMTLTRVDFPAPFSPRRACTRPREISKETSANARETPYILLTPRIRSAGRTEAQSLIKEPFQKRHPWLDRIPALQAHADRRPPRSGWKNQIARAFAPW